MPLYTEGEKNNPSAGVVLADTGQLPASSRSFNIVVTATVLTTVAFQRRNAGNTANIYELLIKVPLNETVVVALPYVMEHDADERFRLTLDTGILGKVQGALNMG